MVMRLMMTDGDADSGDDAGVIVTMMVTSSDGHGGACLPSNIPVAIFSQA